MYRRFDEGGSSAPIWKPSNVVTLEKRDYHAALDKLETIDRSTFVLEAGCFRAANDAERRVSFLENLRAICLTQRKTENDVACAASMESSDPTVRIKNSPSATRQATDSMPESR